MILKHIKKLSQLEMKVIMMRIKNEAAFNKKMQKIKTRNEQKLYKQKLKKERNKYKQKLKTATKFVITSIIAIVTFTIACLFIQYKTSIEVSSTLITVWYGFWTAEIFSLAGIKITKVIKEHNSTSDENILGEIDNLDNTKEYDGGLL